MDLEELRQYRCGSRYCTLAVSFTDQSAHCAGNHLPSCEKKKNKNQPVVFLVPFALQTENTWFFKGMVLTCISVSLRGESNAECESQREKNV